MARETSPLSHEMASSTGSEPDFKLADETQERLFDCPVCLQFLSDPCTTECCNKDFCRSCIIKIRNSGGQCPLCRDSEFKTKRNTELSREVYHLQVYCANKSKGCKWKGDLGEVEVHLNLSPVPRYQSNGCQFVYIQCAYCSNECPRSEMPQHLNECPRKPFSCEYCRNYDSDYDDVCHRHWSVCDYYPVPCLNGCSEAIPRQSMQKHIENDCPLTIVECEFKPYGCKERLPRIEMQTHMTYSVIAHESLKVIARLIKQLKTQDKNVCELEKDVLGKVEKLLMEQKNLKTFQQETISNIKGEIVALCQSMEQQKGHLEKLEAQFLRWEDQNIRIWEAFLDFVHNSQDRILSLGRDIQQLREDLTEHGMVMNRLKSTQYQCPFISHCDNPAVKGFMQLINLDRKYVIAACVCLSLGFLATMIIISLLVVSLIV